MTSFTLREITLTWHRGLNRKQRKWLRRRSDNENDADQNDQRCFFDNENMDDQNYQGGSLIMKTRMMKGQLKQEWWRLSKGQQLEVPPFCLVLLHFWLAGLDWLGEAIAIATDWIDWSCHLLPLDVTYWWLVLNWCHLLVLTIVVGFSLAFAAPQHHAGSVSQCSIMLLRWGLMGRFVICIHPSIPR